jgi:hypothetical protein
MSVRHGLLAPLAACLGVLAVAGCAAGSAVAGGPAVPVATSQSAAPAPSPSLSPPSVSPPGVDVTAFRALARQEASAWPQSPLGKVWKTGVVTFSDDLTSGPVRGFSSDEAKEAFGNGNLVYTGPPPSGAPAGVISWANGATMKVPVLSEARVFSALKTDTGGRCPDCSTTPLAVTDAQPTTMAVLTSRGTASIPAWAFTVNGANGPVFQAALPPGSYVPEASVRQPAENLGPLGKSFVGAEMATLSGNDSRTLEMTLPGGPCDPAATWGGLVAEVGDVVVVGGWVYNPHPPAACTANLILVPVIVRLAAPIGDRVILDAATGLPVTSHFAGAPATAK